MAIGSRALFVLLTLRLLMPPGICVCHLGSPAVALLAAASGTETPAPVEDHDHDHHPGCPASYLSLGLGLKPLPGPGPVELPPAGWLDPAGVPSFEATPAPLDTAQPAPPPPRHLIYCTFLI